MNDDEKKKYIEETFRICRTDNLLVVTKKGEIKRIYCPFWALVIRDVPGLQKGDVELVSAIKMNLELIDIYIVKDKAYYYFNFSLWIQNE